MFISRIAREWKTQYPSFDLLQELRTVVLQDNILPLRKKNTSYYYFFGLVLMVTLASIAHIKFDILVKLCTLKTI